MALPLPAFELAGLIVAADGVRRTRVECAPDRLGTERVILADKGFAGREFEAFVTDRLGAHLVRPDRKDEPARFGKIARVRQWIEAVIDTLKGQLSLEQHGGGTPAGVFARTAQRLLALATAIRHNWNTGATVKRSLIAYDH